MYKKIIVAYDESPEAKRAMSAGIELAHKLQAELRIVSVREPLPAYVAYAEVSFPGSHRALADERHLFYENLQQEAKDQALAHGIVAEGVILEGNETKVLVDDLNHWHADLLVIGRRHHPSFGARFLSSTVHEIAEKVHCSILAVL